ncbi:amidohydrolase family protein [Streptococcus gallolyticus]|uniref:amidohydrolase family protein n=1 Tax=Streptococcus gallolyticus TaxID=315405 RepID=UPI0022835F3E|nr:amidohydrolase family protein [Streptococcus gallolyticus]MCY7193709.1 amidohydrolase [Streptococcus gallolyticus subsp. gallolyticus]
MIIDSNLYWFDEDIFESEEKMEAFLASAPKQYDTKVHAGTLPDGRQQIIIERPKGFENLNYVQGEYKLETMLADMDLAGVDKAVLKIPGCQEWLTLEQCKAFNDGMYDYMKRSQGRLVPLAVLPPYGSKAVFAEMKRCFEELGFTGVQLVAHYGNYYLDNDLFATFFEELNKYQATVYVHHTPVPTQYDALYEYTNVRRSYGRCVDQTTAICRELYSGFFEKHPQLTFVHSMLGGAFFGLKNVLMPHKPSKADTVQRFGGDDKHIEEHFAENIYFEMSHAQPWGKDALEYAVQVLGADHIIFGSSYPVRQEWLTKGADFVNNLDLTAEEKDLILGGNAQRLYHIND